MSALKANTTFFERHGGIGRPVLRAEQAFFFSVPEGEQHRAAWRFGQRREGLHDFQHAGRAAGVVVGPVVDHAGRTEAVARRAVADVVVVAADQDALVLQLRIAAGDNPQHIAVAGAERLEVAAVVAGGLEVILLEPLYDVAGSSPSTATAGLAPFQRIGGQHVDMMTQFRGVIVLSAARTALFSAAPAADALPLTAAANADSQTQREYIPIEPDSKVQHQCCMKVPAR